MKTEEKDIVNVEAFNVIKRDFLASINHEKDSMCEALGNDPLDKKNGRSLRELLEKIRQDSSCYTRAIEALLRESTCLNEFTYYLYMFLQGKAYDEIMASKISGFGIRIPKDESISESMKRVDDFLRKMFRDMRGEDDDHTKENS